MSYLKSAKKPAQCAGGSTGSECRFVPVIPLTFDKEAVATKVVQSPRVSQVSSLGRGPRKIQISEEEAGKLRRCSVCLAV